MADEPFSPSDFLNLPPSPQFDRPALQQQLQVDDDLVLPFISRMLMEEEEMDTNLLDPDHPALLQAQQPFADILSDAAAAAATTTTTKSTGANSAAAANSRSSADGGTPAFANATWPYDPVELYQSQLLRSRTCTYPHDTATHPNADKLNCSVTMDMVNLAFLKGMEEASKFLPATTNTTNLLLPISGSDPGPGEQHLRHQQPKKKKTTGKQVVDGMSSVLFQSQQSDSNGNGEAAGGSRKNKNRNRHADWENDDDLEIEAGRSCKLMASATDGSVDEFVQNWFQTLHEKMTAMTIHGDDSTEHEKGAGRKGKGSATEVVDLRTLLIHCAQAVATGNRPSAADLLGKIRERSSPRGDATQRLAHCFAKGLEARLAGTGSQVYKSLMANRASTVDFFKAYKMYLAVSCFTVMAFKFSNVAINKAIAGKKKVHIVEYGEHYGFQWPPLLGSWANQEGEAPKVRITVIDHPQPGFRPAVRIEETGRRLSHFARQLGIPFRFHSIAAKWETVCIDDLNIEHDEALIINGLFHFGKVIDEGADIDSLSPRDTVLSNIQKMRPDVFILCIENSSYHSPFFLTRFREALFYYSAMFDMMDALAPRDNDERILVEQDLFGHCALNAIACEGSDRVERPETYKQWQVRNDRAGLRQLPLDPDLVESVSKKVKDNYDKNFVIDVDQQWLLQGWKGRILYAISAWVANDSIS